MQGYLRGEIKNKSAHLKRISLLNLGVERIPTYRL